MVFKGTINSVTRARAYYLCKIQGFPIGKSLECVRSLEEACGESKKKAFSVTKTVRNTYDGDDL